MSSSYKGGFLRDDTTGALVLSVDSSGLLKVFDVTSTAYGADRTGVTDARTAINAAFADAVAWIAANGAPAKLLIPPGLYNAASGTSVYAIPRNLASRLLVSGYGAQIKLSTGCPRFLDFAKVADGDVFQNVTIEGLRIDANNVAGKHHVVFGCWQNGTAQTRLSFADITVRDVHAFNIPTSQDDSVTRRVGLELYMGQLGTGEAALSIQRVLIERVRLDGGNKGFNIIGAQQGGSSVGYTMTVDEIKLVDCRHDTGTLLTSNPSGGSLNFQVGSGAAGGRVELHRCYGRGSGDVGVETDGVNLVAVHDTVIDECAGNAFYHTNFETPTQPNEQVIKWIDCTARNFTTPGSTGGGGVAFRTAVTNAPVGRVVIERGMKFRNIAGAPEIRGECVSVSSAAELVVRGFYAAIEGVVGSSSGLGSLFRVSGIVPNVVLRDLRAYFNSASTGAPAAQMLGVDLEGAGTSANACRFIIDGLRGSVTTTGWATGQLVSFGTLGGHYRGTIRHVDPTLSGGWKAIAVPSSATATIDQRIDIDRCDFTNIGGGNIEISVGDATNRAKVFVRDCILQTSPTTAVASATTVTLPNSGEFFTISGTTAVTSITSSWFGRRVTLQFTNAAPVGLTDGSNLLLNGNGPTTQNATITLVSDGTNWIETSRVAV